MLLFLLGLLLLFAGYRYYGKFVERVVAPDDRETPAVRRADGVDFVTMPHWKNMLIQLLNIAGVGPVIGVILGIKFGTVAFVLIPVVNLIAGATHDFLSGMMSLRNDGANLPTLIRHTLGRHYAVFFNFFMTLLLLLVVAVFINVPASLIDKMFPDVHLLWWAVVGVFVYYIAATLFPVDKIIGTIYPFFGGMLLVGSGLLLFGVLWSANANPMLLVESAAFKAGMFQSPVVPVLFVTIACGIISGFHATQSPIVARTMQSEKQARSTFYGMMVVEGVIAMIWAAGAMAIYIMKPELMSKTPMTVLFEITDHFLGKGLGLITVIAVVVLAVTSGDTAMRSLRLSLAETFRIDQKPLRNRIGLCIPLIVIVAGLLAWSSSSSKSFNNLWNYFAWGNQILAASTLLAGTVWLGAQRKPMWIAAVPAAFMTFIVTSYILWVSPARENGPWGGGLALGTSYWIGAAVALAAVIWTVRRGVNARTKRDFQ